MALRTTTSLLLTSASLSSLAVASTVSRLIATPVGFRKRISTLSRLTSTPVGEEKRVSTFIRLTAVSIHQEILFDFLEADNEIWGVTEYEIDLADSLIPEWNPYRPRIPESFIDQGEDFYNFAEENQNILRQQHNLAQAGDTTFPWQMFGLTHSEPLYTLGSISRFFHEDWGLIRARYVRFDFMQSTTHVCAPVGLVRNKAQHEWVVTNRLDLSHADLVVGMVAALTQPVDGEYGWVIVDGPNLQSVADDSEEDETGETFAWSQTGAISNAAEGRIIGRRVGKKDSAVSYLEPGQLYIQLESFSLERIRQAVLDATNSLQEAVTQLQADVDVLKSLTVLDETFTNLNATLASLQTQISDEKRLRQAADLAINARISNLNFVTASQLSNAVSSLQNSIAALQTTLNTRINTVEATALEALTVAQSVGFDAAAIEAQITLILAITSELDSRPKNRFPVVDGSVPPNLVYLDDGTLVYTESN